MQGHDTWGLTKDWIDIYHPKQLIILCHSLQLRGSGVKYMNRRLFQKKAKSGLLWVGAQEILMGGCFGPYVEVSYNQPQQQPTKQQQHKQISGELQISDTHTSICECRSEMIWYLYAYVINTLVFNWKTQDFWNTHYSFSLAYLYTYSTLVFWDWLF